LLFTLYFSFFSLALFFSFLFLRGFFFFFVCVWETGVEAAVPLLSCLTLSVLSCEFTHPLASQTGRGRLLSFPTCDIILSSCPGFPLSLPLPVCLSVCLSVFVCLLSLLSVCRSGYGKKPKCDLVNVRTCSIELSVWTVVHLSGCMNGGLSDCS